jgi:hypothetical protein
MQKINGENIDLLLPGGMGLRAKPVGVKKALEARSCFLVFWSVYRIRRNEE